MTSNAIRRQFLLFFKSKNHLIVPSAPIVLKDDPTLLFTNSGMNQFKDSFLGYKKPQNTKIANTQKCLRVSGKHNDLDDVGKDTYHHTMFEMLGNWSFGDYFKKEAIAWAWELLTEVYKIPKKKIYVTVFEGDKYDKLEKDIETYNFWKLYIDEDRIINGNKKDNFWEMGTTGPCGPCSEIHIDIRPDDERLKIDGKTLINKDHPQVIEIWNLVFMEFLRKDNGTLEKLPNKNIDTGMGFERLCMILQGKTSNYDTDVFIPLIQKVEQISGFIYGKNNDKDIAIRVIVDHIRAVAFAIADGQLPSNTGAGYVIRRILRRAISYSYRFLNIKNPFIYELVDTLTLQIGESFPELKKQNTLIKKVIKEEEISFLQTIDQGLARIYEWMELKESTKILSGKDLFMLYDTYGFPLDLSKIIAEEKGFIIDEEEFEAEMRKQKERGKASGKQITSDWTILLENEKEDFIGYDFLSSSVKISRYRKIENNKGIFFQIVLSQTPFYAESGGQIGDTGFLVNAKENVKVLNTLKENNLIIHIVEKLPNNILEQFEARVDKNRREAIMKNHTTTHLLHQALREKLGTHIEQKGSFVGPYNFRFDFSHFQKMTDEELAWVENFVNERIAEGLELQENRSENIKNAIKNGAIALFGEKYGEKVRTVQFGNSLELCGGTHVKNTQEIKWFKLINESSSAAGIRRIEAITGDAVISYYKNIENQYNNLCTLLKNPKDPLNFTKKLLTETQELKKENETLNKVFSQNEKVKWKDKIQTINEVHFIAIKTNLALNLVKEIALQLKNEINNLFLIVGSSTNNKSTISVCLSDDLVKFKKLNASNIVKELSVEIEGNGGGQPQFATASGKKIEGIDIALEKAKKMMSER